QDPRRRSGCRPGHRGRGRGGNRHRASRRRGRHGQGDRSERECRKGPPNAAQGHGSPRRRVGDARDRLTADATIRLVVGLVRGRHGLDGRVRIEVLTDKPEARLLPGARLFLEGEARPLTIESAEPVADGPGWWLTFREIGSRNAAERLRERYLEVEVERDADLEAGQAYWHEIVGSEARGTTGRSLGQVVDIYRAGETEVYVVRGDAVGEFDVPAVRGL